MLHLVEEETAFDEVQGAFRQELCVVQCCHTGSHVSSRMRWSVPAVIVLGKLEEVGSPTGRSIHALNIIHQRLCSTACFDCITANIPIYM